MPEIKPQWRPKNWWELIETLCLAEHGVCYEDEDCPNCPRGLVADRCADAMYEALLKELPEILKAHVLAWYDAGGRADWHKEHPIDQFARDYLEGKK